MNKNRSDINKKNNKKKWMIGTSILAFLGLGIFLWNVYTNLNYSANNVYREVDKEQKRDTEVAVEATEPISIALLGIDTGIYKDNDGPARSDAIVIATVNPKTKTTTLVSIPRDTYALMDGYEDMVGYPYYDKLTHAFAFGGIKMSLNSIQELLSIPVDYYVEMDMKGLIDVVDAIGGITIKSPLTFDYEENYFVKGKTYKANGVEALAFARMRKTDPEGDYGRQKREKLVIKAMLDQILSLKSVSRYKNVLTTLEDNLKTNLTFDDMMHIYNGYRNSLENFNQDSVTISEMYIDDIFYAYSLPEERVRISNLIREELELETIDVNSILLNDLDWSKDEGYLYENIVEEEYESSESSEEPVYSDYSQEPEYFEDTEGSEEYIQEEWNEE